VVEARRYPASRAIADLAAAGLAPAVLAAVDGRLEPVTAAEAAGGFLGAGLDSRTLEDETLFVALAGERADGRDHAGSHLARGGWVLAAPRQGDDPFTGREAGPGAGVLLADDPVRALQVLASCWRRTLPAVTAAVTGTNGKTTTKDLLAALLRGAGPVHATAGNLNNHLGVPVTVLGLRPEHRFGVIETGASAVGEIAVLAPIAAPTVGIITNASPAHLAEFGSLEGIIEGKGELVAALPAGGAAVLNADSPGFDQWRARTKARVVSFGATAGDHRWSWRPAPDGSGVLTLDGESWLVPLPGEHNGANLAAAILAARALGAADGDLRRGLATFAGSPHRGVRLDLGGRRVLDDAYNANPRSMVAAARSLLALPGGGRTVAVLGWMAELGDDADAIHRRTGAELAALGLDELVAVGDAAAPLAEGFAAGGGRAHRCATCAEAADHLTGSTAPGDRILVKGSRSAAMERVLTLLAERFAAER
jgi:UDP-N-acetylmuramoyl-tripeptide--D-alanyl-D-alanine ligase